MEGQGRVKRRREVSEKGKKSNRRGNEKVATTRGPGICATDQTVNGVSLVDPTSSQDDTPGAQVDTPPPPSLTTPTLPPMSNSSCRTHKDKGKSQGKRDSRGRGGNEAAGRASEQGAAARGLGKGATDQTTSSEGLAAMPSSQDNDSMDDDDQDARVKPQEPTSRRQMAIEEAADTVNLDVKDVRPTMPAGTSNGPQDELNKIEKEVEKGEGDGEFNEGVEGERTNRGADKKAVTVRGSGESATDQTTDDKDATAPASSPDDDSGDLNTHRAGGVSLVKPTSSQDDVPGTHINAPSPPPPSTPNLPFGVFFLSEDE
ncbi:hypothetical protein PAXINDRAFT_17134 [Paxillus involutus ATCC 200175]|uniref:Uncharacterized protein n=1 Tax=Paxillus involutus ATCC 200175 TaxID=664439 RepID=A0A0C9TRK2_PAXIN|nr:hypothetical protein PAXINDRAFT_17134 [Paxillus involutus ATCC 200175]